MKKKMLLLLFLAILPVSYADDSWIYSQYLVLSTETHTQLNFIETGKEAYIEYLGANISFFPRDTESQSVLKMDSEPRAAASNETIFFSWENPEQNSFNIRISSKVRTEETIKRVKRKVQFPITNLSEELKLHIKPQQIIDTNKDIKELASKLAEGEDDLYIVANKIALWVSDNVDYNLSTANIKASEKASWVLKNRQGVCDEITSLFISLVRSVGIPARFVSGISYTNSQLFEKRWGPHGWAEVYFRGEGWIPFDVTYGEFGYLDPTHIVSKISLDAGESTSQYMWRGRHVRLETDDLENEVNVEEQGPKKLKSIGITANVLKENAGFGSFNAVEAEIDNLEDYYQSANILISQTTNLSVIGEMERRVVLKPREKKSIYWIVRADQNLKSGYLYMFPISVYSGDYSSNTSFISVDDAPVFSFEDINKTVSVLEEEEVKVYSKRISLECDAEENEYYVYDDPKIKCSMRNLGNVFIDNISICLNDDCKKTELGISQAELINFTVYFPADGINDLAVTARSRDISKAAGVKFNVLDAPNISIGGLQAPESVSYKDVFNVSFILKKSSASNPLKVVTTFGQDGLARKLGLEEMNQSQLYMIELGGKDLSIGKNRFYIKAEYEDKNGRGYSTEKEFYITLENVTFWQRIIIFFKDAGKKANSFFA